MPFFDGLRDAAGVAVGEGWDGASKVEVSNGASCRVRVGFGAEGASARSVELENDEGERVFLLLWCRSEDLWLPTEEDERWTREVEVTELPCHSVVVFKFDCTGFEGI